MVELTGQVLGGRYRVEMFLGRGGMAEVYKVWDQQRAVFLALKMLHEELAEDQVFIARFEREAKTLEMLQHPNIVRFYGMEKTGELAFFLMDFIDGLTLRKEIFLNSKRGLSPARILEVMRPVCAALYYAHHMGMVHCDIKPDNIMTHRNGTVYLTDFGIARMTEASTQTPVSVGTPAFMAPEQLAGKEPTPAADIYALGVVLYEMLTGGKRPFTGEAAQKTGSTAQRIVWEKRHLTAPSPCKFAPEITAEMEAVVLRCLERSPRSRFRSALELLEALEIAVRSAGEDFAEVQTRVDIFEVAPKHSRGTGKKRKEREAAPLAPLLKQDGREKDLPELENITSSVALKRARRKEKEQPAAERSQLAAGKPLPAAGRSQPADKSKPAAEKTPPGIGKAQAAEIGTPAAKPLPEAKRQEAAGAAKSAGKKAGPHTGRPKFIPLRAMVPHRYLPALIAGVMLAILALALLASPGRAPGQTPEPTTPVTAQVAATLAETTAPSQPASTGTPQSAQPTNALPQPLPSQTAPVQPARLGGSAWIAFASDRSGSVQLWILDPNEPENYHQVTDIAGGACQPSWSPDGKRLAFTTPCKGPSVYYPGSTIKIVTLAENFNLKENDISDLPVKSPGVAGAFDPAWSPDGQTLAYTALLGANTEIRTMDLVDQTVITLSKRGTKNAQPAWSRDGKYIAYVMRDEKNWDALWVMRPTGDSQEMLSRLGMFSEPSWSPDGENILVSINKGDNIPTLAMINRAAPTESAVTPLIKSEQMMHSSISPDGQWIIFWTSVTPSNSEIMLTPVNGQQRRALTNNKVRDFQPAWSPEQ